MVLTKIRRGLDRFWAIVDSEVVGIFQAIVYVHIALGGLYGAAIAGGTPQAVEDVMGTGMGLVWLWMCMGSIVCLLGKAAMKRHPGAGVWLQLTGDWFVLGALVSYIIATFETSWWGKALFGVFIVAAIAECVLLLIVRDFRRIIQEEKEIRRGQP